ncbi:MAG: glycoside hydrolase [Gracilimonas sp.]|uniref:WD40/YVTN/BNR-like repeat-containing protein n=1 Tax=Gracilimonas sp. TaxID=1974203 RepID=UPI003750FCC1|nr:glycoside hydrolase [Gracilimonas sp.]
MSYLEKLIFILSLSAAIISCGSESESEKWQGTWENTGLDDHYITALDYSDSYLFVAGKGQLFRKDFSTETAEWLELDIKINSENSEFGDVLFTSQGVFAVVRNTTDYSELPENYVSLYKSENTGQSWESIAIELTDMEKPFVLRRIAKQTSSNDLFADAGSLIFKSTNNGETWFNQIDRELVGVSEFLYISTDHPKQIWTGGWNNIFSPYLVKSEDGGQTWTNLNEEIYFNTDANVYATVVHLGNEKLALIGLGGSVGSANVIRKSEDGGETWITVLEGYNTRVLKNSEIQPNRVYASGRSPQEQLFVAISDDYGDSWEIEIYEESRGSLQTNDMVVTKVNGKETIYFGTNKGVYSLTFE